MVPLFPEYGWQQEIRISYVHTVARIRLYISKILQYAPYITLGLSQSIIYRFINRRWLNLVVLRLGLLALLTSIYKSDFFFLTEIELRRRAKKRTIWASSSLLRIDLIGEATNSAAFSGPVLKSLFPLFARLTAESLHSRTASAVYRFLSPTP